MPPIKPTNATLWILNSAASFIIVILMDGYRANPIASFMFHKRVSHVYIANLGLACYIT